MRESTVEDTLDRLVRALGGETRKVKWIGRRGAPDRMVLLPVAMGFPPAFLVELKRPGKTAEAHQEREHERLRAAGLVVHVWDTVEKVGAGIQGLVEDSAFGR